MKLLGETAQKLILCQKGRCPAAEVAASLSNHGLALVIALVVLSCVFSSLNSSDDILIQANNFSPFFLPSDSLLSGSAAAVPRVPACMNCNLVVWCSSFSFWPSLPH